MNPNFGNDLVVKHGEQIVFYTVKKCKTCEKTKEIRFFRKRSNLISYEASCLECSRKRAKELYERKKKKLHFKL